MITFNKPHLCGDELNYIRQAVLGGGISGNGDFTKKCHNLLQEKYGFKKVLLTTSCGSNVLRHTTDDGCHRQQAFCELVELHSAGGNFCCKHDIQCADSNRDKGDYGGNVQVALKH